MRRRIHNIIFNFEDKTKELFQKGFYTVENNCVLLKMKNSLTLDTYFNAFPLKKWKKYTNIKNLSLNITLKGKIQIAVMESYYVNKQTYHETWSSTYIYDSDSITSYDLPIKFGCNADLIYIKLTPLKPDSVFYGGYFFTNIDESLFNNPKIAIGICTYKREDYVTKNIENLKNNFFNDEYYKNNVDVFISDNGHTLSTYNLADNNIRIFLNENLGGSGGFCRCMLEAFFNKSITKKYSYILLMDDDIYFEIETLKRLMEFTNLIKAEFANSMIAFSMFSIERPYIQYTKGKIREKNVSKCINDNLDLRFLKNVILNESETNPNFSGWWCHCIPANYINSSNLPFPFFIRCDDTEYGCRYKNDIITLNGFGIWHPDFIGKHPISMSYYDVRNNLIFMTESINNITKDFVLKELFYAYKNSLYLEYDKALLSMKGFEDFIKGPIYLNNIDAQKLNNEIRKYNYEYVAPPEKHAQMLKFLPVPRQKRYSIEMLKFFAFLPAFKTKYINCDKKLVSLFNVKKLYCYNPDIELGYYLIKNRKKAKLCLKKYKQLRNYIEKYFDRIINLWRDNMFKFTTLESWLQKLKLNPDNYINIETNIKLDSYEFQPLIFKRDNAFIRWLKHILPWYTQIGAKVRDFFDPPHFTVRSDLNMYLKFIGRNFLKISGLSFLNKNMREMHKFKNIHKGERCFITCTGPSLTISDLNLLKNEITFGVNSITKAYPLTDWRPTYYVLVDAYAYGEILKKEDVYGGKFCEKDAFLHYRINPKTKNGNEHYCLINYSNHWKYRMDKGIIKICDDPAVGIFDCFTVTNMAITLAAYMGFKDIYILGADATYKLEKTHFIEGEWEKIHKKAQRGLALAVQRSMVGYIKIKQHYNKKGINIYNATRGGMLEIFPRVDLDEILKNKEI